MSLDSNFWSSTLMFAVCLLLPVLFRFPISYRKLLLFYTISIMLLVTIYHSLWSCSILECWITNWIAVKRAELLSGFHLELTKHENVPFWLFLHSHCERVVSWGSFKTKLLCSGANMWLECHKWNQSIGLKILNFGRLYFLKQWFQFLYLKFSTQHPTSAFFDTKSFL